MQKSRWKWHLILNIRYALWHDYLWQLNGSNKVKIYGCSTSRPYTHIPFTGHNKKILASKFAGPLPVKLGFLPRISQWPSTLNTEAVHFSYSKLHGATSEKPVFYNGIQYCTMSISLWHFIISTNAVNLQIQVLKYLRTGR